MKDNIKKYNSTQKKFNYAIFRQLIVMIISGIILNYLPAINTNLGLFGILKVLFCDIIILIINIYFLRKSYVYFRALQKIKIEIKD